MTCVVGACHDGKVYIGCDSLSTDSETKRVSGVPKVFVKDEYIVGGAGSWRAIQIFQHVDFIKIPKTIIDFSTLEKFMVMKFVPWFGETLKSYSFSKDGKDENSYQFLIGVRGVIFSLEEDNQINYHVDFPYDAIGSGYPYAMGAMCALWDMDMSVEEKIMKAIQTAGEFSTSTGGPINVLNR